MADPPNKVEPAPWQPHDVTPYEQPTTSDLAGMEGLRSAKKEAKRKLTHEGVISKVRNSGLVGAFLTGVAFVAQAVEPALFAGYGPWAVAAAAGLQYAAGYFTSSTDDDVPLEYKRIDQLKTMSDQKGIKETLELYEGAEALAVKIAELARDGVQPSELFALLSDSEVGQKVVAAVEGVQEVDDEIQDLDLDEVEVLAQRAVSGPFAVIRALRGEEN